MNQLILFLKGVAMGAADVVPGVSGGTIAFITGIYEELLNTIRSVNGKAFKLFFTGKWKSFWQQINGKFLLPLFAGILVSFVSLAKGIGYLLEHHPILLWAFFFGLIVASTIFIGKQIKQWNWQVFLMIFIGAAIAFYITIATPSQIPDKLIYLFFSGAIAICAMILPGISGSFILLLIGAYALIFGTISSLVDAVKDLNFSEITTHGIKIGTVALGCLVGILSFSHVVSWAFKKYYNATLALLTGFMIGSLNKVWPWKETITHFTKHKGEANEEIVPILQQNISPSKFTEINQQENLLLGAIICAIVGFAIVFVLERFGPKDTPSEEQ